MRRAPCSTTCSGWLERMATPEEQHPVAGQVTISAVGDILMRRPQPPAAFVDGRYDFDYVFEAVAPHIAAADLAIGNLETVFAGPTIPFARYRPDTRSMPLYNCPDELAPALRGAGFHVLTTANNHCLDQGPAGLCRTLDVLDEWGFRHTGTARTRTEAARDLIIEAKGFRIGILAYTYGTNLMPLPADAPWMVNLIQDDMLHRTRAMKARADLVLVCLHAGVEFVDWPSATQRFWVNRLFHHGADAVLGCHPHVLQPMETRVATDIDGIEKRRFVIHSLGNFTATLMRNFKTLTGVILHMRAGWRPDGMAEMLDVRAIPTFVDIRNRFRVVAIDDALETAPGPLKADLEQARRHAVSVLAAVPRPPVPLWESDELATVACGEWLRRPNPVTWSPERVRLSQGTNWPLSPNWHKNGIVFVRDHDELAQLPQRPGAGCIVLPRALAAQVPMPPWPVLAVDDVDAALQAMTAHACLRHRGKRVLVLGRKAPFLSDLLDRLSACGTVATNVRGRRHFSVVTQFLASLPADCDSAVFEVLPDRRDARKTLRLMRPDVIVFADADACRRFLANRPFALTDCIRPGCLIILPRMYGDISAIHAAFPDCEVVWEENVSRQVCAKVALPSQDV